MNKAPLKGMSKSESLLPTAFLEMAFAESDQLQRLCKTFPVNDCFEFNFFNSA